MPCRTKVFTSSRASCASAKPNTFFILLFFFLPDFQPPQFPATGDDFAGRGISILSSPEQDAKRNAAAQRISMDARRRQRKRRFRYMQILLYKRFKCQWKL